MNQVEQYLFSWTSVIIHTAWFIIWFFLHLNINTLTLVVSLEAIYITLLIGLGQQRIHEHLKGKKK